MIKKFYIQGSAFEPYEITFNSDNEQIKMSCTCPAGQHRQLCKHIKEVINANDDIKSIIDKTPVGEILNIIADEEKQLEKIKKDLFKRKKQIKRFLLE